MRASERDPVEIGRMFVPSCDPQTESSRGSAEIGPTFVASNTPQTESSQESVEIGHTFAAWSGPQTESLQGSAEIRRTSPASSGAHHAFFRQNSATGLARGQACAPCGRLAYSPPWPSHTAKASR
jgi:hypothetical protein